MRRERHTPLIGPDIRRLPMTMAGSHPQTMMSRLTIGALPERFEVQRSPRCLSLSNGGRMPSLFVSDDSPQMKTRPAMSRTGVMDAR